jgi:predicted permease
MGVANLFEVQPLIFQSIYRNYGMAELQKDWLLPFLGYGIMLFGFIISFIISKALSFKDNNEKKSFLFQGAFNNYSFLPLPIVMTLMGNSGVAALILSALGGEIAAWTLGITIMSSKKINTENLKHLLSPPLIAIY